MSDIVWISPALGRADNIGSFVNSLTESEHRADAIEWGNQNVAGLSLPKDCFPAEIYGDRSAKESDYRLADLFYAATVWVVSKAAADVLRQFDLGAGSLYPVKVLKKDRLTPVDGEWFCINFGNRKEALLLSETAPMREAYVYGGEKAWKLKGVLKDGDVAVSQAANTGADVWVDPLVARAFFVSDDLGRALKKTRADKGFFLHKCRVI